MNDSTHITIKDVARRANVSVSTVSRVLNKLNRVSPSTRNRVLAAIEDLGFVQSSLAVSMVTGLSKIILIVVPDFINIFYGAVIQGVERELRKQGYLTMVTAIEDKEGTRLSPILTRMSNTVDGTIIIPTGNDSEAIAGFLKPVVLVDRSIPNSNTDSVTVDNVDGVYRLTKELLDFGHYKIGIVAGNTNLNIGADRFRGYEKALLEYGLSLDSRYIRCGNFFEQDGYTNTMSLLLQPDPPTAIVACNNLICTGCIHAINELGLKIGQNFSLVGFDDHLLASEFTPGITVIDRPSQEMGSVAAQLLLQRINGEQSKENRSIVLPVKLIRRGSVVPPAPYSLII